MQSTPEQAASESPSLTSLSVAGFLESLAAEQPAPGGGAAAALAAAAGAALIEMVCRFSHGRAPYAAWMEQIEAALQQAGDARQTLREAIDADATAFAGVAAAYRLPRATRDERLARRRAIDTALAVAAEPPLRVASASAALSALTLSLVGRTNVSLVSDLGAAGELLAAALRIAALNVEANAAALKAEAKAADLRRRLDAARAAAGDTVSQLREAVARVQAGTAATSQGPEAS